jgi:hypothetical protein
MKKISINDAEHPLRKKAIEIMEFIADYLGKPKMFDCKNGDTTWYDIEDSIVDILNEK